MADLREHALAFGVQTLADVELLTLLLGTGSAGESAALSAAALLESSGGLVGIARLGPHALARRGVGPAKATRIAAAVELGRRALLRVLNEERVVVDCFERVVGWAQPRLGGLEHEEVWLLSLDGKYGLKSARRIAQGGLHGCALLTRDVLSPALRDGASAIVLVHNHPSGDPTPSPEDIAMTRAVRAAGELVGIPLIDHVVVSRSGACSLAETDGPLTATVSAA
jgi:DNA repair protein RadC